MEGRVVDSEAAVNAWLRRLADANDNRLAASLRPRLVDRPDLIRTFDRDSTERWRRQLAVLVDAGRTDAAERLLRRLNRDLSLGRKLPRLKLQRAAVGVEKTPIDIGTGWVEPVHELASDLSPDIRRRLRNWGIEPRLAASPVESDGRLFIRGLTSLTGRDSASGELLWTDQFDPRSEPAIALEERVTRLVTTSLYGTVSVDGTRLRYVVPQDSNRVIGPTTSSYGRRLGVRCLNASTGERLWQQDEIGVPLAAPIQLGVYDWLPVRDGRALGLTQLNCETGEVVATFVAAMLPDRDERIMAPLFAAAVTTDGEHVLVAFDEGLVASFNTRTRAFDWVRPLGLTRDDAYAWDLPGGADLTGGIFGMIPRLGRAEPRIDVTDRTVSARLPGWSNSVSLDLLDGADGPEHEQTERVRRIAGGLQIEKDDNVLVYRVDPARVIGQRLLAPQSFSYAVGSGLFVQTTTAIRKIGRGDLVAYDLEPTPTWNALQALGALINQPLPFLSALVSDARPLIVDDGKLARSVPDRPLALTLTSTKPIAATPVEWGATAAAAQHPELRVRPTYRLQSLPTIRLTDEGPLGVTISVDSSRRTTVNVRVDGRELDHVRLPGRNGDQRLSQQLARVWQQGPALVVQLGRELFGMQLVEDSTAESGWRAEVTWPRSDGFALGHDQRGLLRGSRYDVLQTPVGWLQRGEDGRFVGNVAVVPNTIAIARMGHYVLLDFKTGREIVRRCDRRPYDLLTASASEFWLVDSESGRPSRLEFESPENGNASSDLDQVRYARVHESDEFLAANEFGRWYYRRAQRTLFRYSWSQAEPDTYACDRMEHLTVGSRAVCIWEASKRTLHILSHQAAPFKREIATDEELSHLALLETPGQLIVGLAAPITEPGILDSPQPLSDLRVPMSGDLLAFEMTPSTGGSLKLLWRKTIEPCSIPFYQPPDMPLLIASWNQRIAQPDGKLSSLPVGHVRIFDRRTGELLLEERSNNPIRPGFLYDYDHRKIAVSLGGVTSVISFKDE